jgi:hypothetical protein
MIKPIDPTTERLRALSLVPSRQRPLLKRLVGHSIREFIRLREGLKLQRVSPDDVVERYVFDVGGGVAYVGLSDGTKIGICSDESINSLQVWEDLGPYGVSNALGLGSFCDTEFVSIDNPECVNSQFISLLGKQIAGFSIYQLHPEKADWLIGTGVPHEVGLGILFVGGEKLIVSLYLDRSGESLCFLTESMIDPYRRPALSETILDL